MTNAPITLGPMPDANGYFGEYGGSFIPPNLSAAMADISKAYDEITKREDFQAELHSLFANYVGRPSPIFHAKRLSDKLGGAQIHLKREDLNHTGAHKINHCLGEALLAKFMNKKKVIAETGAGQHGVALATACALVGIPCEIHMGQVDIEKEHPNTTKIRILGATLVPVTRGQATLKEAVDNAFEEYLKNPEDYFYAIGSIVGPDPFPRMVRDFQSIVGKEAREQFQDTHGKLPDIVAACVGGGSNAIGLFTAFLNDASVKIVGVEPAGKSLDVVGQHAATLTKGKPGVIHGMRCYVLEDSEGVPSAVHSIASGLDYPGIGPQHSYLKDAGRVTYETASDKETLDAFMELSHVEGIIPALESAHAVAWAIRTAPTLPKDTHILINLSGRGDKDADYVAKLLNI
ncbi:Tryptophan synthase beta chain 2 [Vanrija pseudolonga]|uniref:Tryptophan synthase n=1 Tax=Vanrija pseudolonga TaxID=143232 RepID=A0AAF0YBT9_9TREE|nr:Tryptophan synthase beta chain 2 [Vanrija pseudolonga]